MRGGGTQLQAEGLRELVSAPFNANESAASGTNAKKNALQYGHVLLTTLDRIGCGGVMITGERVAAANEVSREILKSRTGVADDDSEDWTNRAVSELLGSISGRAELGEDDWITAWGDYGRPLAVLQVPIDTDSASTVLVLVDLERPLQPSTSALKRIFGLTSAETRLARGIAVGFSPADLARQLGVSRTTVRSQLAAVFSKTETRRQSQLVALLARLSILP